jgi:hypothetical protein
MSRGKNPKLNQTNNNKNTTEDDLVQKSTSNGKDQK